MSAGAEHFGGLQRALSTVMDACTGEELALVSRFLQDVTDATSRYARTAEGQGPPGG